MKKYIFILGFLALSVMAAGGGPSDPPLATAAASASTIDASEIRITQPLMSNWRFTQDDAMSDEQALSSTGADWQLVDLPHTWNAQDAASYRSTDYKRGLGWYGLRFATPAAGARHWLEFGAASLVADVWLNGQHLGQHKGGATAFRFDVTGLLSRQGTNVVLVKTDNSAPTGDASLTAIPPLGGDFNVYGGLHRYVSLISTAAPAHFDLADMGGPGVYATTRSTAAGIVSVRAKLKNDGAAAGDYIVRVSMLDAGGRPAATSERTTSLEADGASEVVQDLTVPNPRLWQGVANPYLYQLVAELLRSDGSPIDKVVQSFGIREMRFDPDKGFFLNGEHVRLNGVGMQMDLLGKGWAQSEADWANSLAAVKEIGANAVRYAHVPYPRYAYQRASELGLVVWSEAALGWYTTVEKCARKAASNAYVASARQQLQEMIRQQYNHASVAMWAVGNESTQSQFGCENPFDNLTPVLKNLHDLAKAEDASRPTVYAEYPLPVERTGPFATEGITDLFGTNRYYLWYEQDIEPFGPLLDAIRARTPEQPLGVSEYGGGGALSHHTDNVLGGYPEVASVAIGEVAYQPEEYQAYLHERNYAVMSSKPYLWGTYAWAMFDFGSANRNEGDVQGVNTKGLMTFDHQTRKDAFYFYKANWSAGPTTHIVGRRYKDRAYPVADVKVYSNAASVELMVNGASIGVMTRDRCAFRTCVFHDVRLAPGTNTITATGNHAGTLAGDTVEWVWHATDINIAAGRLASGHVAADGARFGSDDFFAGGMFGTWGVQFTGPGDSRSLSDLSGTRDPQLYQYFRLGRFTYNIPLADGAYEVTLGFVEPSSDSKVGGRVFVVNANGAAVLKSFDVLAQAGGASTAVTRTFPVNVSGGRLVLEFMPVQGDAVVSNIRIARKVE